MDTHTNGNCTLELSGKTLRIAPVTGTDGRLAEKPASSSAVRA